MYTFIGPNLELELINIKRSKRKPLKQRRIPPYQGTLLSCQHIMHLSHKRHSNELDHKRVEKRTLTEAVNSSDSESWGIACVETSFGSS